MEQKKLVGNEVKKLSNLFKRRIDQSSVFNEYDNITGLHGMVIGFLFFHHEQGDLFQRDIETEFSIRRSTATGILQLMEKNELIIREAVSYDARLKKIILTPKAISLHEKIRNEIMNTEMELAKGLTEEEIQNFFATISKMKKNIE
ncbi:MAG: MarR family transcriptional regulator [Mobilitalea sp.]